MQHLKQRRTFIIVLCLAFLAFGTTAHAIDIDQTISLEYTAGDEIYAEIYRDSGTGDGSQLLARRAQREYGVWPDWMEAYNSESSYDRYAYLKATAQEVGQWSFVAEIANRDNANQGRGTHVAFVRINLTVHETAGSEYPAGSSTGYVLCESLSMRESPDPYANVIATLTYGTTFSISQKNGSWWYAQANGKSGWINSSYALLDPQYYYAATETPVFAYASADAKRIGLIDAGTQLAIIAETNEYYIVSFRSASGFISR